MQELLARKKEIDRLYREAKAMEFTVNAAAQDTIDKALAALDEVIEQVGDDFGPYYADIVGWITLGRSGAKDHLMWSLQISPCKTSPVMYTRCNGKWVGSIVTPEQKRGTAEIIMFYWPRFMALVKTEMEKKIKADMQKKLDEVGCMVDFLQRAEKFKI